MRGARWCVLWPTITTTTQVERAARTRSPARTCSHVRAPRRSQPRRTCHRWATLTGGTATWRATEVRRRVHLWVRVRRHRRPATRHRRRGRPGSTIFTRRPRLTFSNFWISAPLAEACWLANRWQRCTRWPSEVITSSNIISNSTISNSSSSSSNISSSSSSNSNSNSRCIISNKQPGYNCRESACRCPPSLRGRPRLPEAESTAPRLPSPPSVAIRMASTRYYRGRRLRILRRPCPLHTLRSSRRRTPSTWPRQGTGCTRDSLHRRVSSSRSRSFRLSISFGLRCSHFLVKLSSRWRNILQVEVPGDLNTVPLTRADRNERPNRVQ